MKLAETAAERALTADPQLVELRERRPVLGEALVEEVIVQR